MFRKTLRLLSEQIFKLSKHGPIRLSKSRRSWTTSKRMGTRCEPRSLHQSNSHANDDTDSRNASPASQILARNIPLKMSMLNLERYFGRFGTIENIKLSFCPRLQESNAIVTFVSTDGIRNASNTLGSLLKVGEAGLPPAVPPVLVSTVGKRTPGWSHHFESAQLMPPLPFRPSRRRFDVDLRSDCRPDARRAQQPQALGVRRQADQTQGRR